ncbi:MAG: DinB family protein [Blastocatellia bacterium]
MTQAERQELIDRYTDGYNEVVRALEGFTAEMLTKHPLPGKWSAAEIIHHLADSEMTSAIRIRRLLVEDNPAIEGYPEAVYAERLVYNVRDIAPAMEALRAARATTVQLLERMTEEDWQRKGTHSEAGAYGTEIWLKNYAAHAHDHASQIRRLREAM